MGSQGPLPFLSVSGTEVANAARTLSYLRNGLGDTLQGHWELGVGDLCGVLYRLNGGNCVTPDTFVSPAADPAPWYDPLEPGSEAFLGVVLLNFDGYDSTVTRVVVPRIQDLGGATFSGQRRGPREWKFRAALVSASDAGAEYGLRWLTSILEAPACDTCDTGELTVRLVCPPEDCTDEELGEWTSYDIALTGGPTEVESFSPQPQSFQDTMAGCRDFVTVEWSMVAGNPFLYKRPEVCLAAEIVGEFSECTDICDFLFGDPGDPHCCEVDPPDAGVLGAVFTFESVSGMGPLLLQAFVQCPATTADVPELEMEISGVPAGATLVVDAARHRVTLTTIDPATGDPVEEDAESLIDLSDGRALQWVESADCGDIHCFCARTAHPCSQGGDTTVEISTQLREG